uniref:Uncharacterized protein n=1 Tax=Chromera velia CCMP2878 TaxID=1169474 RepID=A0A0G4HZE6_9ALVE|eukprot:Cvel_9716.t1-p1 / transcript=Cvel_9716.t1 / gene=Cvel_9716 / organism=Chromera_velia_CCMP2878 / gene_product=hypothetical protein / transcript_product=hypothetical protein / location=Cvel_scaffold567:41865-45426(-) / protein_length=389 / sequence_SO=supercontig / SO=protein_coding / is_pseudo=false
MSEKAPSVAGSRASKDSTKSDFICDNCMDVDNKLHKQSTYRNQLMQQMTQNEHLARTARNANCSPGLTGLLIGAEMVRPPESFIHEQNAQKKKLASDLRNQIAENERMLATMRASERFKAKTDGPDEAAAVAAAMDLQAKKHKYREELSQQLRDLETFRETARRTNAALYSTSLQVGEFDHPSTSQVKANQTSYGNALRSQMRELDDMRRDQALRDRLTKGSFFDTGNKEDWELKRRKAGEYVKDWKRVMEQRETDMQRERTEKSRQLAAMKQFGESLKDAATKEHLVGRSSKRHLQDRMRSGLDKQMAEIDAMRRQRQTEFVCPNAACAVCAEPRPMDMLKWQHRETVRDLKTRATIRALSADGTRARAHPTGLSMVPKAQAPEGVHA